MIYDSPQKRPIAIILTVALLASVASFSLYSELRSLSLRNNIKKLQKQREELAPASGEGLSGSQAAVDIQSWITRIQREQVSWAKVIETLESAIPRQKEGGAPTVRFRSYTGNEDGSVSVSAATAGESQDPLGDVGNLLAAFLKLPGLKNVFIPSVTKNVVFGEGNETSTVVSFLLNFTYVR